MTNPKRRSLPPRTSSRRKKEADLPAEGSPKSLGGDPEGLNPEEKPAENPRPPDEATAPYEDEPSSE
jgi:hypothetical protein